MAAALGVGMVGVVVVVAAAVGVVLVVVVDQHATSPSSNARETDPLCFTHSPPDTRLAHIVPFPS